MTTHAETLATVRATGRRITSQRQIVLDVIENATEHLDAEGIFQKAREKDSKISLATVYRTLGVLKEMGLVDQNYVTRSHDREHYEPVGAPRHYHFTCLNCHRVIEFQSASVIQLMDLFQEELGVKVLHACMCLEGYCQDCVSNHQLISEIKP